VLGYLFCRSSGNLASSPSLLQTCRQIEELYYIELDHVSSTKQPFLGNMPLIILVTLLLIGIGPVMARTVVTILDKGRINKMKQSVASSDLI